MCNRITEFGKSKMYNSLLVAGDVGLQASNKNSLLLGGIVSCDYMSHALQDAEGTSIKSDSFQTASQKTHSAAAGDNTAKVHTPLQKTTVSHGCPDFFQHAHISVIICI